MLHDTRNIDRSLYKKTDTLQVNVSIKDEGSYGCTL